MGELDVTYLGALLAGLISFLSPCVLPLTPAYICFVAGTSLDQLSGEGVDRAASRRALFASIAFVLGFTTVFVLLGASASAINPWLVGHLDVIGKIAGAVIILFGLHYMGLFRIALFYREARAQVANKPTGLVGAYVVGLAFAFGWTPCVGPFLASVFTIAASRDSLEYGMTLLAVYALGIGVPFILAALMIDRFLAFMKRFRRHFRTLEIVAGGLLAVMGVLMMTGGLQEISFWLLETFPALATIG